VKEHGRSATINRMGMLGTNPVALGQELKQPGFATRPTGVIRKAEVLTNNIGNDSVSGGAERDNRAGKLPAGTVLP